MRKGAFQKYTLHFKQPGGTSRGVLTEKTSWFITVWDTDNPAVKGIGECGFLRGLSIDPEARIETMLKKVCADPENEEWLQGALDEFPCIRFGLEQALLDLRQGGKRILFPSPFTEGKKAIPINGLIWMGTPAEMQAQVRQKLESGFACLKLKIGAIRFEEELKILQEIRRRFSPSELEIRVDANGAFSEKEVFSKLEQLAPLALHSIEQPVAAGQWELMQRVCAASPLPVALDEELIGISQKEEKQQLLYTLKPQYIILKPSLTGGFQSSHEWITAAQQQGIGWWITSALESNVGLNAIAQWTFTLQNPMPQGLGTGQLFVNNFSAPLEVKQGFLHYRPEAFTDYEPFIFSQT